MFTKISLKAKLIGICMTLATLTAVVGGSSWYSMSAVLKNYAHVAEVNYPNASYVSQIETSERDFEVSAASLYGNTPTAEELAVSKKKMDEGVKVIEENSKKYEDVPFVEGEEKIWNAVTVNIKDFKDICYRIYALSTKGKAEQTERDQLYNKEYVKTRDALRKAIDALQDFHGNEAKKWSGFANDAGRQGVIVLVTVTFGSFLFAGLFGYFFSRSLARTLQDVADQLASGGREVTAASKQISEASAAVASSAAEQASALQQTSASIDEMSAMIGKNADNAKKSQDNAGISQQTALKGKDAVEQMVESIDAINRSNNDIMLQITASNEEIGGIVKVIAEIGNKTKIINDIVFQTKLLSFNASVEAARAGEHGKGFAVVAEEVGNLAQMSGNAAKEISQMLDESIRKVESTVINSKSKVDQLMASGRQKVESGISTAKRCGESLDEIVANVGSLNLMINEIATASREQAQGVQEITKAMGQLDQVTQENAAASQQAASAGEELSGQAVALQGSVERLVQVVQGGEEQTATASVSAERHGSPQPQVGTAQLMQFKTRSKANANGRRSFSSHSRTESLKMAAGSDVMPSENDPRFKDI